MNGGTVSRTAMLVFGLALAARAAVAGPAVAAAEVQGGVLSVRPLVSADSVSVTVTGPAGYLVTRVFDRGEAPELGLTQGGALTDGVYLWEVRLNPAATRTRTEADAGTGPSSQPLAQSGQFHVQGGVVVAANDAREGGRRPSAADGTRSPEDFFINDDLVVVGSTCGGFDCVNNEVFGLENLLLKQNNNHIRSDDTSAAAGFPANDWQIRFNDDNSGGLDRFAVDDLTAATIPMSILAGAPSNSLFVDATGRLGLRTGAPVQAVHAVRGDTPGLRLDQDGSGGFAPQAWDVAGNESNFFIRDVTGGNTLPFRLRPGAPSSSIDILGTSGNVGIGTGAASASLHVFRNNATAQLRVEEATATTASRNMLRIVNNGASTFRFDNTASGLLWGFGSLGSGNFFIGSVPGQPLAMQMTSAGNMIITGTYSSTSDRNAKADITEVDAQEVLSRVAALPVSSWRFKQGTERHLGPMAQDFSAAFGLGGDDTHIAPSDVGGVALAAIQALKRQVDEREAEIRALNERLAALESRLGATQQP